jgi:hypothetical protein
MGSERNLGTVPTADTAKPNIDYSHFVRVDLPAPVGTKRWTDRRVGTGVSLSIDGSSQTWTQSDVIVGLLDQGTQDLGTVSQVSFANLDYTWTNWANTVWTNGTVGLKGVLVHVWWGWFDWQSGTFTGAPKVYKGKIDRQEHLQRSTLALTAGTRQRMSCYMTAKTLGAASIMPPPGVTIYLDNQSRILPP